MVNELKTVLDKVVQLKEEEQRQIAMLLEQEMTWDETFLVTQSSLEKLADEALLDFSKGKTTETDW